MKKISRLLVLSASFFAVTPSIAFELSHADGKLSLPSTPANVVTFDLAVLDTLNTLGVSVAGVPKSTYEGSLAKFKDTAVVGTLFEPDYEALKKVEPDLIFAGGRSQKAMPKLAEIAPTVAVENDRAAFLPAFKASTLSLGKAFDKEAQAVAELDKIQKNVDELHRINKGKTSAFLFTINGRLMPHVPGDRFGYSHELTGLSSVLPPKDADAPAQARPEPDSPEAKAAAQKLAQAISSIAQADPDWLIVMDRGAINGGKKTGAETLAAHPEISQTSAYKEGRVYYADPNGWYVIGGGLSNLQSITSDMLAKMK
jgi:iron complex transport system substrate-binding protein